MIQEVGDQDGDSAIGIVQQHGPHAEGLQAVALPEGKFHSCLVGGRDPDDGFGLARLHKGFDGRKGRTRRAAEDDALPEGCAPQAEQLIAGTEAIIAMMDDFQRADTHEF